MFQAEKQCIRFIIQVVIVFHAGGISRVSSGLVRRDMS